ncbi:MAG: two-component system nitrate/nitrite response regulator NarL [Pseudohongiellaceae bacterium]|jgi:two-component system nitrate/nitrite response regulator NarL
MIKVMLVDDHPLFREGVRARLSMCDEIMLVGEAENGRQLLEKLDELRPDVVLMDINMPEMNGMDVLEVVAERKIHTKFIILSMHDDKEYIIPVIRLGAYGYMLKDVSGDEMIKAITVVFNGEKHFSQDVAAILAQQDVDRNESRLTNREQLILRLISLGYGNKKIAQELNNSVRTVETHKRNITKKLNINTTSGLVRYAIKHGIDK